MLVMILIEQDMYAVIHAVHSTALSVLQAFGKTIQADSQKECCEQVISGDCLCLLIVPHATMLLLSVVCHARIASAEVLSCSSMHTRCKIFLCLQGLHQSKVSSQGKSRVMVL